MDEFEFCQIRLLTTELAAIERLNNQCLHFFSVAIDPILFALEGNEDINNFFDEVQFRPDRTALAAFECLSIPI